MSKMNVKEILKKVIKVISGFCILILLYLLVTFVLSRIPIAEEQDVKDEVTIYIKNNGVHTDIVVPTVNEQIDWSKTFLPSNTKSLRAPLPYLAIGWGDKGFYLETPTWADLKFSVAVKAAFGLSESAIHTTYYPRMVESDDCKRILISKEQYVRLAEYIQETIERNPDGSAMHIAANYGPTDAFYEAEGKYSVFKTCNSWANKGLKECGQKACLWTAFEGPIFLRY